MLNDIIGKSPIAYAKLQDDLSRLIFRNLTLYNFTGESGYIKNLVETAPYGKKSLEQLSGAQRSLKKICIFGAGTWGQTIKNSYPDADFLCFIENNEKICGQLRCGIPVISFNEWLENYKDSIVIISSKLFYKEMYEQLVKHDMPDKDIINAVNTYWRPIQPNILK